jgi:hypothetical protein
VWHDVDADGRVDLVVVGEWMPIVVFRNIGGGRLTRAATPGLEKSHGWWNRFIAGDFTGDGRIDLVVGNLGLNSRLRATPTEPATMYVKDFDGNGFVEQIVAYYNQGQSYPLTMRDDLIKAIPSLKARFLNYKDYARRTITEVLSPADLEGAIVKQAFTFASSLVRQTKDRSFVLEPLPQEAQLAPVYGILAADVDSNGKTDFLLAGNFDGVKPEIGRLSASYGVVLRGDGRGTFSAIRAAESGFFVPGQGRDIRRMRTPHGLRYVVARNNERPLVFGPTTQH